MTGKQTDGLVSRYINRKFSTPITNFIVKHNIPLTPNQVSIISFFLGILSAILYIVPYVNLFYVTPYVAQILVMLQVIPAPILAGALVQISSIIDGVDGELARATNRTSKLGGFMDTILDRLVDVSVITCFSLFVLKRFGYSDILFLWIILALSGTILVSYLHSAARAFLDVHPVLVSGVPSFSSRDIRLFIIFLGSIAGVFFGILFVLTLQIVAVLSYLYLISSFIGTLKKFKENKK